MEKAQLYTMLEELGVDLDEIDDSTPLISSGIIDSLALVDLLVRLEAEVGLRLEPGEISADNLDSVDRMLAFIRKALNR